MALSSGDGFDNAGHEVRQALHMSRRDTIVAVAQSILRMLVGGLLIVAVMLLVPDEAGAKSAVPIIVAIAGSVLYAWAFRRQVRGVYSARFPAVRAIEALVLSAAMFLAIFSVIYVVISDGNEAAFTERLDSFTAYYYSLTVLATVGFGDIAPVSVAARSVSMVQMALDIVFIAALIRIMGGVAKKAIHDRNQAAQAADGSS